MDKELSTEALRNLILHINKERDDYRAQIYRECWLGFIEIILNEYGLEEAIRIVNKVMADEDWRNDFSQRLNEISTCK